MGFSSFGAVVEAHRKVPGSLLVALEKAQDITLYLPVNLQRYIAAGMGIPPSKVSGVVTFYSFFTTQPRGRHTIKFCMGTACYVKGIKEVMSRVENEFQLKQGCTSDDRRFSLEAVRCLGACGLAPVMVVGQDTFGSVKADNAAALQLREGVLPGTGVTTAGLHNRPLRADGDVVPELDVRRAAREDPRGLGRRGRIQRLPEGISSRHAQVQRRGGRPSRGPRAEDRA